METIVVIAVYLGIGAYLTYRWLPLYWDNALGDCAGYASKYPDCQKVQYRSVRRAVLRGLFLWLPALVIGYSGGAIYKVLKLRDLTGKREEKERKLEELQNRIIDLERELKVGRYS